jgi:hypothetical protein
VTEQLQLFHLDADGTLALEEADALAADLLERCSWSTRTNGALRPRPCRCVRPGAVYSEDGAAICVACGHERGGVAV